MFAWKTDQSLSPVRPPDVLMSVPAERINCCRSAERNRSPPHRTVWWNPLHFAVRASRAIRSMPVPVPKTCAPCASRGWGP